MEGVKIGLEVHIQLKTESKVFCSCPTNPYTNPWVKNFLEGKGVDFEFLTHEPVTRPADSARARKLELRQIAKALVCVSDRGPVLFILPGDTSLSIDKAAAYLGAGFLRMATHEEVEEHTGCVAGLVPPTLTGIPKVIDLKLLENKMVSFNAGLPTAGIIIATEALLSVLDNCNIADISEKMDLSEEESSSKKTADAVNLPEIPNSRVCDICLGFPGAKPQLNRKAIELAMKIAFALGCSINRKFLFSRKTYFYPDLAKNFQITQQEIKIAKGGFVNIKDKVVRLRGIHLEEDPAKVIRKDDYCLLDYNRSGTPLVEIVTEPDMTSPAQARMFLQKLQQILEYLYVTDFQKEGCMRMDANISLTKYETRYDATKGGQITEAKDGSRVEIKNISGVKDVEKALNFEILRQKNTQDIKMETRLWNEKSKTTVSARAKEEEEDYGYIFEPDLPLIEIDDEFMDKIQSHLPELPDMKKKRYMKYENVSEELIDTILTEPEMANFFEYLIETHNEKASAVILAKYLKKTLNYHNLSLKDSGVNIIHLRRIIDLLQEHYIYDDVAELVLRELVYDTVKKQPVRTVDQVLRDMKYEKPLEDEKIKKLVNDVIRDNPKAVRDYEAGREESFNFLVGQVMKKTGRHASAAKIREMLKLILG